MSFGLLLLLLLVAGDVDCRNIQSMFLYFLEYEAYGQIFYTVELLLLATPGVSSSYYFLARTKGVHKTYWGCASR